MVKSLLLGVGASLFFATTFVLNREMQLTGGFWVWSASLRFFFMVPLLLIPVVFRGNLGRLLAHLGKNWGPWLLWSTVGFGIFYAPLCFAAAYGPSWLIASTWQITIVAGILLTPLFYQTAPGGKRVRNPLPKRQLGVALVILAGVFLVQTKEHQLALGPGEFLCLGSILVGAVAYPLGNRKMMALVGPELGSMERVFGMTLCSLPFFALLSLAALAHGQGPTPGQGFQALLVALFSGVIATLLFFQATDRVKHHSRHLAVVESTQAGEVVFALLGGWALLQDPWPAPSALGGIGLVVAGIVINALLGTPKKKASPR